MDALALQKRDARARVLAQLTAVLGSRRGSVTAVALLAAGGGAYAYYVQEARRSQKRQQPARCAWPWMQYEPCCGTTVQVLSATCRNVKCTACCYTKLCCLVRGV